MKIKECCEDILDVIFIGSENSLYHKDTWTNKPCFNTGEEGRAMNVPIKYCPFCGKEIEVTE